MCDTPCSHICVDANVCLSCTTDPGARTFSHAAARGRTGKFLYMCIIYVSRMRPCLSPPSISPPGTSTMICGGERCICRTDSSKHNGSIYLVEPGVKSLRARGRDRGECEQRDKESLGDTQRGRVQENKHLFVPNRSTFLLGLPSANMCSVEIL